jgi:hypothetical protein
VLSDAPTTKLRFRLGTRFGHKIRCASAVCVVSVASAVVRVSGEAERTAAALALAND